jgi:hypothetical protein
LHFHAETGDALPLAQFKRKYVVDAAGETIPLLAIFWSWISSA